MKQTKLYFTFTFIDDPTDPFDDAKVARMMAGYMLNDDEEPLIPKEQITIAASDLGELSREVTIYVNNVLAPSVETALNAMKQDAESNGADWCGDNLGTRIKNFYAVFSEKQEAAPGVYERLFETSFEDNLHFMTQIGSRMMRGFGGILVIIVVLSYLNFSMSGMCKKNANQDGQSFSNKMMFNGINVLSLGLYGVFAFFTEANND